MIKTRIAILALLVVALSGCSHYSGRNVETYGEGGLHVPVHQHFGLFRHVTVRP